jgi:hypothetical protein
MVTLPTVSFFSCGCFRVERSSSRMISLLSSFSSLWMTSQANGSLPANGGSSTSLGLHLLHAQEMGGRTDTGMGQASQPGLTGTGPFRLGSVAPSHTLVLFTFFTLSPSIASFWRCQPHVQDGESSRMKFGLLQFIPRGCSYVTLWSSPPLGVISSCSRTRTGFLICSFELVVTPSFMSMHY